MTEDEARAICRTADAHLSIKKRRHQYFVYVARWLPATAVKALGHKPGASRGQAFDRYVCPLSKLGEIDEATLLQRIAELPVNPNKQKPSPDA